MILPPGGSVDQSFLDSEHICCSSLDRLRATHEGRRTLSDPIRSLRVRLLRRLRVRAGLVHVSIPVLTALLSISFLRWWGPLIAYSGLIFWLSSQPQLAFVGDAPDYLLHFLAYFGMGLLTVRAFARGLAVPVANRVACLSVALSVAYAASDEFHQSFVPGRVASYQDFVADGLGVLVALAALLVYWRLRARTEREPPMA